MSSTKYFFWLSKQALEGLLYAWQISLILILILLVTLIITFVIKKNPLQKQLLVPVFCTIFVPALIIFIGTIYRYENNYQAGISKWAAILGDITLPVQLLLGGYLIYINEKYRLVVMSLTLLQIWFSYWAFFLSAMSITNHWI